MKRSIKLLPVLLLLITTCFAGVTAKPMSHSYLQKMDAITFSSLPGGKGIAVKFKKGTAGKAIIIIYDDEKNVLRKDELSDAKSLERGYILNKLENGDYTLEVTLNKQVVTKVIHVYDEGKTKMFIIKT